MLCDCCKRNNAIIFINKIEDGIKIDYSFCAVCASRLLGDDLDLLDLDSDVVHNFAKLTQGIYDKAKEQTSSFESKHEIKRLEKELKILVAKEEYEWAAVIRDQINELDK